MENQENFSQENVFQETAQDLSGFEAVSNDNAYQQETLPSNEINMLQKQLEEEKSLRKQYESVLSALGQNNARQDSDILKQEYEKILKTHGEAAANIWLNQQMMNQSLAVQSENQTVLAEVQDKYKDIYAVPEVRQAIEAYLKMDMDPTQSLKHQGFPEAVEYIASIYKAGYESALSLKFQNDSAKSRMGSSITSGMPSVNSGKVFSRAEIASMDAETFARYEKTIFDQMAKGLIK